MSRNVFHAVHLIVQSWFHCDGSGCVDRRVGVFVSRGTRDRDVVLRVSLDAMAPTVWNAVGVVTTIYLVIRLPGPVNHLKYCTLTTVRFTCRLYCCSL